MGIASDPPRRLDDNYVRKTLHSIKETQKEQSKIEAARTGAFKAVSRMLAVFGTLITAGAIGGFVWVWDAQTSNALQDAQIQRVNERATEHDPSPPGHGELESAQRDTAQRVREVELRIERYENEQAARYEQILSELRRIRGNRRNR